MGSTDVRARLGDFASALRQKDWGRVEALLADDTSWYVGGTSSLAGEYEGKDAVLGFLGRVAADGFDRPGCRTDEAEILVGEHHHGIFWFFNAEIDGEKVWSYEIWLVELAAGDRVGAVFSFAEDGELQRRFWG